nr:hypothetical protein Iba_chr14bCG14120 [Ipomoea batatas]
MECSLGRRQSVDGESEDFDGGAVEGLEEGVVGRLAVVEDADEEEGGLLDRNGEMEERRDLDEDIAEGREERVTCRPVVILPP